MAPRTDLKLPLALTIGEPAGIGPDVALAAFQRRAQLKLPPFYLIGDPQFIANRAKALGLDVAIREAEPEQAAAAFASALPIVPLDARITAKPGKPDATSAPAAIAAIRRAITDVSADRAAAVVTNPVAKSVLYRAGFADPGHTEYLARLAEEIKGSAAHPVMMLWCEELAVVPVTIHLPLKDVPGRLSKALIVQTGHVVARDLKRRFGIANPRIVVAGLNPHAGEDGTIGDEDLSIVKPAVEQLKAEGVDARGPLPADTMFHAAARERYDVA